MKSVLAVIVVAFGLQACSTISQEAKQVHVYSQDSNLLIDCKKLGRVSSEASILKKFAGVHASQAAENALRQSAFEKYGADTVVITNVDYSSLSVAMQGTAFRCE